MLFLLIAIIVITLVSLGFSISVLANKGPSGPGSTPPGAQAWIETGPNTDGMTHYWDCCKTSCAWNDVPALAPDGQVNSCDADGKVLPQNVKSICDTGGTATMCKNRYPWIGKGPNGSHALYGYIATPVGLGKDGCGKCYELELANQKSGAPDTAYVQMTNMGGITAPFIFDFAVPGGGFGVNTTGCGTMAGWSLAEASGGPCKKKGNTPRCAQYGGLTNVKYCDEVFPGDPEAAKSCKNVLFGVFPDQTGSFQGNLKIKRYRNIDCPKELSDKTGASAKSGPPPPPT